LHYNHSCKGGCETSRHLNCIVVVIMDLRAVDNFATNIGGLEVVALVTLTLQCPAIALRLFSRYTQEEFHPGIEYHITALNKSFIVVIPKYKTIPA
jgi:hypothetical protein